MTDEQKAAYKAANIARQKEARKKAKENNLTLNLSLVFPNYDESLLKALETLLENRGNNDA